MSSLLARVMLAIFMLPSAGVLMSTVLWAVFESDFIDYPYERRVAWVSAALITWLFVGAYWILLWRKSVRWTSNRRRLTLFAAAGAALFGGLFGLPARMLDENFSFFVFTSLTILTWLIATVFIFRETPVERAERLDASGEALTCPTCGYNLTGLNSARCPECGSTFTLDELVRRQPAREQAEIS